MNEAHIHLLLNHFPVIGTFITILILGFGIFIKNNSLKLCALILFIFIALISIPVLLSGDVAEKLIEDIPGVSLSYIEEHEDIAVQTFWLIIATGVSSLLAIIFYLRNKASTERLILLTLFLSVISFIFISITANTGAKIRHSEIRTSTFINEY